MIKDAQGQPVSGATADAVALYDQAVRAFNLGYGDAPRLFDAACEASPDFTMAHLAKAWLFVLANDPIMLGHARTLLQSVGSLTLNDREHGHCAALGQAVTGARSAAASVLARHLMGYPFDLVAHQAVTLLDGYLGRFRWVRDRTGQHGHCRFGRRIRPAMGPSLPSTDSASKKQVIMPAPRTSRARRPN
jgi:hypothetical protein